MNEFEWRRQLRQLRDPVLPHRDLWLQIETALVSLDTAAAAPTARAGYFSRHWLLASSLAAVLLAVVGMGWLQTRHADTAPLAAAPQRSMSVPENWKPADPRLAGAAIELDAARHELRQAMQQSPRSIALQRLLLRTLHQQTSLRELDQAG